MAGKLNISVYIWLNNTMTLYRLYKDNKRLQVGKDARAHVRYTPL